MFTIWSNVREFGFVKMSKGFGVLWKFQVLELGRKWLHSLKGRQMYFLLPSHIISVSASPLNVLA
jgi:hypothetical protein